MEIKYINRRLRIKRNVLRIISIVSFVFFCLSGRAAWESLSTNNAWPTTYNQWIECIILPMIGFSCLGFFLLGIKEEKKYKKKELNPNTHIYINKFYVITILFFAYTFAFIAIFSSLAKEDDIFYSWILIALIIAFWIATILYFRRKTQRRKANR